MKVYFTNNAERYFYNALMAHESNQAHLMKDCELRVICTTGHRAANSPAIWHHLDLSDPVPKVEKNYIKTDDHKRSKPQTLRLYCT